MSIGAIALPTASRRLAHGRRRRVAFVTNFCTHYRIKPFEALAQYYDIDYYFFSDGGEWYWRPEHGIRRGAFQHTYLPGIRLGNTRVSPRLPVALLQGGYDVFVKCINGRFALPVTYGIARLTRRPFVLWTGIWTRLDTPVHRVAFPLVRHVYQHANAIVAYGDHVRRYLDREGVDAERIFLAPQAVDNDVYRRPVSEAAARALRAQLGIEADQPVVLYVGRLSVEKGLRYLLEAFRAIRDERTVLVIAGTGEADSELRLLTDRLGLSARVRFPGYISPSMTRPYYAIAEVAALPSVTTREGKEPWGLVVNEAFNQGVPVIVSDAVGAAAGGLVQDGMNGFIVPEQDASALGAALNRVVSQSALRGRLGLMALDTIREWTTERMVSGFRGAIEYACAR